MKAPISVIIVEDDHSLRQSLSDYLHLTGFAVEAVGSGMAFYQRISGENFDVAVIDIGLPDQSGFVLVEYARHNTTLGLIIITANDSITARITGYESGSDLFLAKPLDCRELAAAIVSIASRNNERKSAVPPLDVRVPERWILDRLKHVLISPDKTRITLTAKEFQLLDLLASFSGKTVPREKVLQHLYNHDTEYDSRALDSLASRIRKKMDPYNNSEPFIITAYATGYTLSAEVQRI